MKRTIALVIVLFSSGLMLSACGSRACDDGNTVSGDGCSDTGDVEAGYSCTGSPSICVATCGDGMVVGTERCDDGNSSVGDGCDASCAPEAGYSCSGTPSTCLATCGDGIMAGAEACDDGNIEAGDGCDPSCTIEAGYSCIGTPSDCAIRCGDGIVGGTEQCDDGNLDSGDGCNASCVPSTGENCSDTIVMSQAVVENGKYTWSVAAGSVTDADGDVACDVSSHGPDVVIKYVKSSANLAGGGKLLHVKTDTPDSSTTANYLNLEIKDSCQAGSGSSLKCLWYKDNWDSYLDLPAGTYYIWVQKNSPVTSGNPFPAVEIVAEEVAAAAAEGEGCFAPYTSASSIYTAPAGSGMPHTWTIPATINSFDMSNTWGEPGSISCDNTSPYGDIHGVDAVIEFDKQSATSVLKVDVQNLDPMISQSDLNVEVLSVCDPTDANKISRNCRANKDTFSLTAPSPSGPVYLWVTSEATGEEFRGASVQVTEIFPAVGESWPTAQSIAGSGAIATSSAQRLDVPTCFPATGNIHWFSYTLAGANFSLQANNTGYVGVYDANGQQQACVANASVTPVQFTSVAGQTVYIAVQSPTTISSFTISS